MNNSISRIPKFKNHQEAAAFWDTHDVTDYLDELEPVEMRYEPKLDRGVTVRFDSDTFAELQQKAHPRGIGVTTLIRIWIMERLNSQRG